MARNDYGTCSECLKKINLVARKCPWCHSRLEVTSGQLLNAVRPTAFKIVMEGIFLVPFLILFLIWYYWWDGYRVFEKGKIEGVVHLYPSKDFDNYHMDTNKKYYIKEIIFEKTYEFDNSYDDVELLKNAYPARSKCFKEVFAVSYKKFQKYFDLQNVRGHKKIDRLMNQEPSIIYGKNGEAFVRYEDISDYDARRVHSGLNKISPAMRELEDPYGEYDWDLWSHTNYDRREHTPNIHIYCRYKSKGFWAWVRS